MRIGLTDESGNSNGDLEGVGNAAKISNKYHDGSTEIIVNISGTEKHRSMLAASTTTTPSGAAEIVDDAAGFKYFKVSVGVGVALGADEYIVVGYSTTVNDAAVLTNVVNKEAELDATPTGAVFTDIVILDSSNLNAEVIYDGTNTIKRIAAVTKNIADLPYNLITVE